MNPKNILKKFKGMFPMILAGAIGIGNYNNANANIDNGHKVEQKQVDEIQPPKTQNSLQTSFRTSLAVKSNEGTDNMQLQSPYNAYNLEDGAIYYYSSDELSPIGTVGNEYVTEDDNVGINGYSWIHIEDGTIATSYYEEDERFILPGDTKSYATYMEEQDLKSIPLVDADGYKLMVHVTTQTREKDSEENYGYRLGWMDASDLCQRDDIATYIEKGNEKRRQIMQQLKEDFVKDELANKIEQAQQQTKKDNTDPQAPEDVAKNIMEKIDTATYNNEKTAIIGDFSGSMSDNIKEVFECLNRLIEERKKLDPENDSTIYIPFAGRSMEVSEEDFINKNFYVESGSTYLDPAIQIAVENEADHIILISDLQIWDRELSTHSDSVQSLTIFDPDNDYEYDEETMKKLEKCFPEADVNRTQIGEVPEQDTSR